MPPPPDGPRPYGIPPSPGQPYGAPNYGSPQIQFGMTAPNPFESRGTTTLVLGLIALIGGLVACGVPLLLGPVAWITGNGVRRDARTAGHPEPGNNKGGRICGIIATVVLVLGIAAFFLVLVAIRSSSS